MKKIFPIIIAAITLSLIGVIYMQYSWFQKTLQVKDEQLYEKVTRAIEVVGRDLNETKSKSPVLKRQRSSPLKLDDDAGLELMRSYTMGQRFSMFEIQEKLRKAFDNYKELKNLPFEFAIAKYEGDMQVIDMQSPQFSQLSEDTFYNYKWYYPLETASGSQYEGLAPDEMMIVVVPEYKKHILESSYWQLTGSIVLTLFIMFAFFLTVRTLVNQRKLSEIKSDFINNMTHEFKTPLATISLAVDALKNEKVISDRDKLGYFSGIIKEENKRMNKHVETILQAAALEKQEFTLNKKPIHAQELIERVMDNYRLVLEEKQGSIRANHNAKKDLINVDEQHFTNLLNNLVDNGIKYSKDSPEITITTHSTNKHLVIRIEDNGIGMSRETVKRIFEKFYRAHTGNIHNVKGFGLGMSYVKTIIDAHKGKVKIDSTLGKGSAFTVEMPLDENA